MKISARNSLKGEILKIARGAVNAEMTLEPAGRGLITPVIISTAARNDPLRRFMRAGAKDDSVAVFSWGELDPAFGNQGVLVAYEQDGQPLQGGVGLVAPGDHKGGRHSVHLTTFTGNPR